MFINLRMKHENKLGHNIIVSVMENSFGTSVSISNSRLIVAIGSNLNTSVYKYINGMWEQLIRLNNIRNTVSLSSDGTIKHVWTNYL